MRQSLEHSLKSLEKWVEGHQYKGYEPFDALLSPLRFVTFHNKFAERLLIQLIRQSPLNLRPLFRIPPHESTKGRGYMAWGYVKMYKVTSKTEYMDKANTCFRWLMENKSPGYPEYCWGNHFDFTSRGGRLPKFEPTIVWSSLIGQAFLDAYEAFRHDEYLEVAKSICGWILNLPRERTKKGACLGYVNCALEAMEPVHNSNMLGASLLARVAKYSGDGKMSETAREAMEYSCTRQLPNGSWYYGEHDKNHWIDNFHTGYNLDSLKCYIENTKDKTYESNLVRGFEFYKTSFFTDRGIPKYYHDRTYPVDIQCASQAIETLMNFSRYDNSSLRLALKVSNWTIENMQDRTGFFYYRILPAMKVKIPMLHWGQATMYNALTSILAR